MPEHDEIGLEAPPPRGFMLGGGKGPGWAVPRGPRWGACRVTRRR